MNENDVSLGGCYLARLSKAEMPVRLERNDPKGGWTARSLTHGRRVRIKDASQLLGVYDNGDLNRIASTTTPNRRSRIVETVTLSFTRTTEETVAPRRVVVTITRPEPTAKKVVLVRLTLLDAAHRVLSETKKAMATREIIETAAKKEYWTTEAETPWATLHAALSREIKEKGADSRFVKAERGKFALRQKE